MASPSNIIRDLNDRFRQGDASVPGRVMMTSGVAALIAEQGDPGPASLIQVVRSFAAFNAKNDPHGEHDFAAFDFLGERLFWKIDYYAKDLQSGSEDPADPESTVRVLTIMLASEY
ncbi:MAG: DUF3768 domain-containing protein [Rhizobiaceae bacterium]